MRGVKLPFFVGCHCAAIFGATVSRQFVTDVCTPAQQGHQSAPPSRSCSAIEATHSWSGPFLHFHVQGSFEFAGTEREPRLLAGGPREREGQDQHLYFVRFDRRFRSETLSANLASLLSSCGRKDQLQ